MREQIRGRCGCDQHSDHQRYTDSLKRDCHGHLKLKYFNWDHPEPSAYSWQDWWSRFSKEGVCGDASAATPEFGQLMFETTVARFIEMAREFRTIPIRERVDHH